MFKWIASFGCASVLLLSLFVLLSQAAEKVRISTPVKTNPVHMLPMLAAEEKGIWKQLGLEVEWFPFTAGGAQLQAMAAGAVDVGFTTTSDTVHGAARGVPLIIVSDLGAVDTYVLWVRTDSPIKTPQDLKGTKIGTARFGGASHTFGQAIFKALGIQKEIKWVSTGGTTQTMALLKTGAIDASLWARFSGLPLKARGEVRELLNVSDYLPKPWSDAVIFAHRDFAKRNPAAVKKAAKAILEGGQFVMRNRDWAIGKLKSELGYSQAAAELVYPELTFGEKVCLDGRIIESARKFLIDFGVVAREKMPPAEELFTTEFVEERDCPTR